MSRRELMFLIWLSAVSLLFRITFENEYGAYLSGFCAGIVNALLWTWLRQDEKCERPTAHIPS